MKKNLLTIWHNPNCSKSREAYNILEINPEPMHSFDYINEPLTKDDILEVMAKLNISDIREILRAKEDKYIEFDISNPTKTQDEIIDIVLSNRILIERPIIIKDNIAVIARPMENLKKLLEK